MKQGALTILISAALLQGCTLSRNYTAPGAPRYFGAPPEHVSLPQRSDTLRIGSFNIEYALRIDSALAVIRSDPVLSRADILLLQEMDAPSTRFLARELGMWFVYYPAALHFRHRRDFGNAVLSRWPIVADAKILLPHAARLHGSRRTATAATIRLDTQMIRVYSAHLGTYANITNDQRRDQLQAILSDAEPYSNVVIGGDMNDPQVGDLARAAGYAWPTREGPRTAAIGRLDHIFIKGLFTPRRDAAGTVLEVRNSSDHRPVWAIALLKQAGS